MARGLRVKTWRPWTTDGLHVVQALLLIALIMAVAELEWQSNASAASSRLVESLVVKSGGEAVARDADVPIQALPEVLVAEDVTPLSRPVWCASHVVVVSGGRTGLRWIDLSIRKTAV